MKVIIEREFRDKQQVLGGFVSAVMLYSCIISGAKKKKKERERDFLY